MYAKRIHTVQTKFKAVFVAWALLTVNGRTVTHSCQPPCHIDHMWRLVPLVTKPKLLLRYYIPFASITTHVALDADS